VLVSRGGAGGLQVLDPYAAQYRHWEQVSAHSACVFAPQSYCEWESMSYNVLELQKWVWTVSSRFLIIRFSNRIYTKTPTQHMTDLRSGIIWKWNWNGSFDVLEKGSSLSNALGFDGMRVRVWGVVVKNFPRNARGILLDNRMSFNDDTSQCEGWYSFSPLRKPRCTTLHFYLTESASIR
jgi:hypothetical protein